MAWRSSHCDRNVSVAACHSAQGARNTLLRREAKEDIDNFNKLAFDACTGMVWEGDSQIVELHITKAYDKANPRIELIVVAWA